MVDEQLGSEDDLLRQAVALLQTRYERGTAYTDLSSTAVAELSSTLEAVAVGEGDVVGGDRQEAVALAHRLMDDDHPELSPMWPRVSR
ncbi:MAG: hypothetical protein QOE59_5099 [Actinomycetota bacterium]|jgi:hypothetical protein|nr:hypothetical protein [Actinomycetota bacterium]